MKPGEAVMVICLRGDADTSFTDNVRGLCEACSCVVQHRPRIPTPHHLVCIDCAGLIEELSGDAFDDTITAHTLQEVAHWISRPDETKH